MTVYLSSQLTNEEYHALPQVGGSILADIYFNCPAQYKFKKKKETKALADGIMAHVCVLEPSLFNERYVCGIDPEKYPDALDTNKQMEAWLKERGIKGYSSRTKAELIEMILLAEHNTPILQNIIDEHAVKNEGKKIVAPKDFEMIHAMRQVIFNEPYYREKLTHTGKIGPLDGPLFELSSVTDDGLKCRWDCVTADGEIWDYKTCVSAHPDAFMWDAPKRGYWLKMALQHDQFVKEFGERPKDVVLLAQSKTEPYLPQAYRLTDAQLDVGRSQYMAAFNLYHRCKRDDVWPSFGEYDDDGRFRQFDPVIDLPTPGSLAYRYGMDESGEPEYV